MSLNRHQFQTSALLWVCTVVLFGGTFFFMITPAEAEETSVSNTVHISTSGNGESSASVKTVINGQTVEDWSTKTTGDITYSSMIATSSAQTVTSVQSGPTDEELQAVIEQLQVLISLYVSLLNS